MAIKNFDEYFKGYKSYDNGGKVDQTIIRDAKKIYTSFKTVENIKVLHNEYVEYIQKKPEIIDEKIAMRYRSVCCASGYAEYVSRNSKTTKNRKILSNILNIFNPADKK